jgi:hypothetical protein
MDAVLWQALWGEIVGELSFGFGASPFNHGLGSWAVVGVTGVGTALFWWRRLVGLTLGRRGGLSLLRAATMALVVFLLLGPAWLLRRAVPSQELVLVLFDDSRSMRLPDGDGQERAALLRQTYNNIGGRFERLLHQTHRPLFFRFGAGVETLGGVDELDFSARVSDLPGAVAAAVAKVAPAPVAAVVLISDGVQSQWLASSLPQTSGVPVFSVGVGGPPRRSELALGPLRVRRRGFDRAPFEVEAQVRAKGLDGERLVFELTDGERPIATATAQTYKGQDEYVMRVEWTPTASGWKVYGARVRLEGREPGDQAFDAVTQDNHRLFLVDQRDKTFRVLYFGGRPSWEFKFVRRALAADPRLEMGALLRVSGAERRFVFGASAASLVNPLFEGFSQGDGAGPRYDEAVFMRLGLRPGELTEGYPSQAEALFPFDLLVWDGIESDFFSAEQLALTRDFIDRRGGAFLILGGAHLAGFADTPLENALPLVLQAGHLPGPVRPQPTFAGFLSGVWALNAQPQANRSAWAVQAPLAAANRFSLARAGADVLARLEGGQPFFAWQRYGEGRSAVMGGNGTWVWHMRSGADDETHHRFWRQLVRALVDEVPEQAVLLDRGFDRVEGVGDSLVFQVRDGSFEARDGLIVRVEVEPPQGGGWRPLPVEEALEEVGRYRADFAPQAAGLYRVRLEARRQQDSRENRLEVDRDETEKNASIHVAGQKNEPAHAEVAHLETAVLVQEDLREMLDADYDPAFLQALSAQSGGAFLPLDRLEEVPSRLPHRPVYTQYPERFGLWKMPLFYLLLVGIILGEWFCRRRWGQP